MKQLLYMAIGAVILALLASFAGFGDQGASRAQHFASDRYFVIGGQHITVPVVALRGPGHVFNLGAHATERTNASEVSPDSYHPVQANKLDLIIREYQYTGEMLASTAICPLLKRTWSQTICQGPRRGLLRRLPEQFDLLDEGRLDLLKDYWTVGRERMLDQIGGKTPPLGVTKIGCDQHSPFCTAIVEVLPNLLAVWTISSEEKSGSKTEQIADAQGAAIVQFVRRGLGPREDKSLVDLD
ncbi:hypothetical protein JQ633_05815 [Bradyrhizobium tropiciagri]|uniref:hypothetical protein n=1 Tax=Bradyrhizobium tropiciagri TaxID=312253 RepID=UPI001BA906E4|nr:hypothetical protein [Bradyrhizobium tropiciagri]MBR0869864.1 hypothetical protein [Bradyrhizobium tropiciagri]